MNSSLPAGWKLSPLGELAYVYSGGTPSRNVPAYWGGTIPWVTTAEIDSGHISSTRQTITDAGLKASAARIAQPGTILLAMYGQGKTRGKSALLGIAAAMNQACAAIEASSQLDPRYLLYYLSWQYDAIRSMSNAGSQDNLSGEIVREIPIAVPTMPEQRAIAEVLDDASSQSNLIERLIVKKQAIKQGMMQQLLTGRTRLPGFGDVWRRESLGDIASPRLGGNYQNAATPSARPLIKMGNIARITIDLSRVESIPDSEHIDPVHQLRFGDVLFNTRNTLELVGKVSIWRDELPVAYYNSNILRLEFKPEYCGDSRYFGYALNSKDSIEAIRTLATGTTSVAAVYTRDLLRLELPVPSKAEQCAIVKVLDDAEVELTILQSRLTKARNVKTGMMQQLLTGCTRLPIQKAAA